MRYRTLSYEGMAGLRVMDYKKETLKRRRKKTFHFSPLIAYIKIPLVGYIIICNYYIKSILIYKIIIYNQGHFH